MALYKACSKSFVLAWGQGEGEWELIREGGGFRFLRLPISCLESLKCVQLAVAELFH